MGENKTNTTIREYKTEICTFNLSRGLWWNPSAAMYADQDDFSLYKDSRRLGLHMTFSHYQADFSLINIEATHVTYKSNWEGRDEQKLRDASKAVVDRKLEKFPSLDIALIGIFEGMHSANLPYQLWSLYNSTGKLPRSDVYAGHVFNAQHIHESEELEELLKKIYKDSEKIEKTMSRNIDRISRIDHRDSGKYLQALLEFSQKYQQNAEMVGALLDDARKAKELAAHKPEQMTKPEHERLYREARGLITANIAGTLDRLSLPEPSIRVWKQQLSL